MLARSFSHMSRTQRGSVLAKRERLIESRTPAKAPATTQGPKAERKVNLFLDSGVFSAWSRAHVADLEPALKDKVKRVLNVKGYAKFIKRNEHLLTAYATMDEIPGVFGTRRTQAQVESSAKKSYDNQQTLKSLGCKPIPIFHQGESFSWLERYVRDGEPYVGIATIKDTTALEQREWLDRAFSVITDSKGCPLVKTHGFGITNISLLWRYPWFTVDSTTWSLAAGFGLIYVPGIDDNHVPDYSRIPLRIITSGRTQAAWSSSKRQYEALNRVDLAWAKRWLKYVGITQEEARYKSASRRLACVKYFVEFSEHYKIKPFEYRLRSNGLLDPLPDMSSMTPPKLWPHMRVIMATMMHNGQFSMILNDANARDRLASYWEIIDRDEADLGKFVRDGITDINYKPRPPKHGDWENDTFISKRALQHLERIGNYGPEALD